MTPLTPRDLPSVHVLLDRPELRALADQMGRAAVVAAAREVLGNAREAILAGRAEAVDPETLGRRVLERVRDSGPALRPVINATGILLHTGLGRAPIAREAIEAVAAVARGYCNLEFDLETGQRGQRTSVAADLLRRLTGAEAATAVNNNAGATVLALRALAAGREVVVSRGQLIEIGGSFRLPEIFAVSGARLREVGTTNRTRLGDYANAIGPDTAALLRVHPSNYQVVGFTESVEIAELAQLARSRGVLCIDDIGSGALAPGRPPTPPGEPTVLESLQAGADLVLASGDKLLGGPQCGLILGSRSAVGRLTSDPLMRALRLDKMTLAALEATLRLALDPERAAIRIPLWSFVGTPLSVLQARAERIAEALRSDPGLDARAVASEAYLGGGSVPGASIPSAAVAIHPPLPSPWTSETEWVRALRRAEPAVVPRVRSGIVLLDVRAIAPEEDGPLIQAIRARTRGASG